MQTPVPKLLKVLSLVVLALAWPSAVALTCPPPPEPAAPNGHGPVHFYRDTESCRIFTYHITYDNVRGVYTGFFWTEEDLSKLLPLFVDKGQRIAFIDQQMAGSNMPVAEYFNTVLGHYFLAIPDEWGAIERGEAGPGWVRTGAGFTARTKLQSPISVNVQRFYGSVSPGPNSHFFTIDMQEARWLQDDIYRIPADKPRWHSEGSPFNVFPLKTIGSCGQSRFPVYRVFNGGASRGLESNHRYSTDHALIDAMVAEGWIGEGIAFCVDSR